MHILITGGAGFVGSNLAFNLKKSHPDFAITCFDNLKRRGSELNVPFLKDAGITFIHGDVRNKEDFDGLAKIDLILECSAEPSVMAGVGGSPGYVINTNLVGTLNCLEVARLHKAKMIFFSTSRVYPIESINALPFADDGMRFDVAKSGAGYSKDGLTEQFPLAGARSIYGATKLASELLIEEYAATYGLQYIINRCGVLAGPRQMGKTDQGVAVLWVARHIYGGKLSYIGYAGKQVRDMLHIDDLYDLIELQLAHFDEVKQQTFNVGGGFENSVSLLEFTKICEERTRKKLDIPVDPTLRPGDLKWFVTDSSLIKKKLGWAPKRSITRLVDDIATWIENSKESLRSFLN